jgi:hypothetical protein
VTVKRLTAWPEGPYPQQFRVHTASYHMDIQLPRMKLITGVECVELYISVPSTPPWHVHWDRGNVNLQ